MYGLKNDKNLKKKKLNKKKSDKKKLEVILCGGSRRQLGGRPTRDLCRPHTLVIIVIIVIIAIIIIIIAISIIIVIIIIIVNTISARLEMKVIGFVVGPSVQNLEFVDLVMARVSWWKNWKMSLLCLGIWLWLGQWW